MEEMRGERKREGEDDRGGTSLCRHKPTSDRKQRGKKGRKNEETTTRFACFLSLPTISRRHSFVHPPGAVGFGGMCNPFPHFLHSTGKDRKQSSDIIFNKQSFLSPLTTSCRCRFIFPHLTRFSHFKMTSCRSWPSRTLLTIPLFFLSFFHLAQHQHFLKIQESNH